MDKRNLKISHNTEDSFSGHKSYSITDILAAGGATAFANKMGKSPELIDSRLKAIPKDAFLTKQEAENALKILSESK